ncbi:phosphate:Na+ symporter [Edaphobacter aggregans]|uniref:Phosphate:Na+ symporter n=1 Tax=Edaphobacter aggregans TaxID=570835 RepID=A0A3R9WF32_9BACT|nr:Na/Pi cotransporter family protein [Edaphobacter aggregans]RSL15636.1 phosphate:Na+ symporter [Edaphobacter aggregans]
MPNDINLLEMLGLLAGGLALFLFGLELMTNGLKAVAGASLESALAKLTANRFLGLISGAFVTAVLNSSTITTVLMVGFVSAGLMTLGQAVPMIMGANVGSTFTAQIMAFNVKALVPFMLAIGFLFHAFGTRQLLRQLGGIVLGLGLLFLGIEFMGDATRPLRTFEPFIKAMQEMKNPLLGILAGAIFTAVVQSSAATLAVVIALASQGLIPLEAGIAVVLGANIGTCLTAMLAGIGKSAESVQVGVVHLLFNVLGVLFWVFFIPQLGDLVRHISPSHPDLEGTARLAAETPRQIANAHTVFSVSSTFILIWFVGPLAKLAQRIVPARRQKTKSVGEPLYLDESALEIPSVGLQRVSLELTRLGELVLALVRRAPAAVVDGRLEDLQTLLSEHEEVDRLEAAILVYIGRLSQGEHTQEDGQQMVGLAQTANNLESVSDIITTKLVSLGQQRIVESIDLARLRDETTSRFVSAVMRNLEQAIQTIDHPNASDMAEVIAAKREIEDLAAATRKSLMEKLQLADKKDVQAFRIATDMIEQCKQIAYFARRIVRDYETVVTQQIDG